MLSSSKLLVKRLSVGESAKGSGIMSFANVPHVDEPAFLCAFFIGIGIINLAIDSSSQQVFLLLHVSGVIGTFLVTIFEVSGKGGCNLGVRCVVVWGTGVCFKVACCVVGKVAIGVDGVGGVCFCVDGVCCSVDGVCLWVGGVGRAVEGVALSVIGSNGGKSPLIPGASGVTPGLLGVDGVEVTSGILCDGTVTEAGRLTGNFGVNPVFLPSSGKADSIPLQPSGKK